jgi:hypothetical protein
MATYFQGCERMFTDISYHKYIYIFTHIYYIHRYIIYLGKVSYFTKMNLAAIWG